AREELAKLEKQADELAAKKNEPKPGGEEGEAKPAAATEDKGEEAAVESDEDKLANLIKEIQQALGLGDFGTKENPIPLDWPKRRLAEYPVIYVGPYIGEKGEGIPQDVLKSGDRKEIEKRLNHPWDDKAEPIVAYHPDEQ